MNGRLRRPPALLAGLALLVAALLLATQLSPYLGDYTDDAELLILGQGLASGQGYAWVNEPDRPPHNRYPPGYPALVAAALLASGTARDALAGIVPAKLATAATLFGSAALLWPLARRRLPAPWAAAALALYALNPFTIRFAAQVMSDVPYILVELAALVWADRLAARAGRLVPAWDLALLGALLAGGAYVRSVGLATAAGVLAWAWWRLGRRGLLLSGGAFVACMLPWWLRDASLAGGWRYLEELRSAQYLDPAAGTVGPLDLLARAAGNGAFVLGKPGVFGLAGFAVAAVAGVVALAGYWRVLRLANSAAEWAAVPLVLAVLVWPIRTGRYLLPVVPLAGIYAVAGGLLVACWLERRAAGPRPRWLEAQRLLRAGVVLVAVLQALYAGRESARNLRALAGAGGPAGYYRDRPDWQRFLDAAGWLRSHAGEQDVAMSRRQFQLYVYSGHYTQKYRFDTSEDELAYLTSGTARKYVVEDAFDVLRGEFDALPVALRARGGDLVLRYESAEPAVRVWELVRPAAARPAA